MINWIFYLPESMDRAACSRLSFDIANAVTEPSIIFFRGADLFGVLVPSPNRMEKNSL